MWIEELQKDHFRVCLREVKTFDGKHQNIKVVCWSVFQVLIPAYFQYLYLFSNLRATSVAGTRCTFKRIIKTQSLCCLPFSAAFYEGMRVDQDDFLTSNTFSMPERETNRTWIPGSYIPGSQTPVSSLPENYAFRHREDTKCHLSSQFMLEILIRFCSQLICFIECQLRR